MVKIFLEFLLFVLAIILILPLSLLNMVLVLWKNRTLKGYFISSAVSLDRWGNREFRTLWNTTLITSRSKHRFGDYRETISSVLGKNEVNDNLTFVGRLLVKFLDFIDKDHCFKSIEFYD